ncbi:MAG: EAL domain-containing protein [Rhodospirillales bacterium]|nr:EAL domain-containing protein [Rhodospirillales bacterium]
MRPIAYAGYTVGIEPRVKLQGPHVSQQPHVFASQRCAAHDATGAASVPCGGTDAGRRILDLLRRVAANRAGLFAVHLHISGLGAALAQPRRRVARPLEALTERHEASLFPLSDHDVVLICRDVPVDEVDAAIYEIGAYASRASAQGRSAPLIGDDARTRWYDLSPSAEFQRFCAHVQALAASVATPSSTAAARSGAEADQPLDSATLATLGRKLRDIRISDLIRQQTALEIHGSGSATPLFRETYVAIGALLARLAPHIGPLPNSCLFRHLTESLDRRMMESVAAGGLAAGAVPLSINLNVSTIASEAFQRFHHSHARSDCNMLVEIQLVDVLADTEAYRDARDRLRAQGYKVLIDGLNPLTPRFLNIRAIDADYFKIWWSPDSLGQLERERTRAVARLVEAAGRDKVLLARTDSEQAVRWALGLGIHRFQGYLIDRIAKAMRLEPAARARCA